MKGEFSNNFHLNAKSIFISNRGRDGARRKMVNHSGSINKSTHNGTTELIASIMMLLEFECWFTIVV